MTTKEFLEVMLE